MVPLRLGFVSQWNSPCERASCLFLQGSRAQWNHEAALTQPRHQRRAPWALFACVTFVKSKPEQGLPVTRALEGMQSICTLPLWEAVCPHILWKWRSSLTEIKSTPVRVHPCPWHSRWMVWINLCPSPPAQLGSKGQCQQSHFSSPQPHPPLSVSAESHN